LKTHTLPTKENPICFLDDRDMHGSICISSLKACDEWIWMHLNQFAALARLLCYNKMGVIEKEWLMQTSIKIKKLTGLLIY
jgi:hypothetical protein